MSDLVLRRSPALQAGDLLGIVAPSRPVLEPEQYRRGKAVLQSFGFRLREGRTVRLNRNLSAGTPQQQAADLHRMFADPEIKAIVAQAGGASAIKVLPCLDYELIAEHPKPFIGMSDITTFHLALYTRCGLIGYHMDDVSFGLGLNYGQASPRVRAAVRELYLHLLTCSEPLGDIPCWHDRRVAWRPGQAEGPLIGGCLQVLCRLLGTPYFPPLRAFEGALFFWEDIGQSLQSIERLLWQLRLAGVLERIDGMLVGTVDDVDDTADGRSSATLREAVLEATAGYRFPIMAGMEFGHGIVNIPMPIGVRARVDADRLSFGLLEGAVRDA